MSASTLTEVYEHLAVALPGVLGHDQDAGEVVVLSRVLLLGEGRGREEATREGEKQREGSKVLSKH